MKTNIKQRIALMISLFAILVSTGCERGTYGEGVLTEDDSSSDSSSSTNKNSTGE